MKKLYQVVGVLISIAFAVVVVGGSAQAKGRGGASLQVIAVGREAVVGASATASFAAKCPASDPHPLGGEFAPLAGETSDQLALAASRPQGRRGWFVAVKNLVQQPQGYFAGVICARSSATFAYPSTTFVVTPSNPNNGFGISCPSTASHGLSAFFGPESIENLSDSLLSDNAGNPHGAYASVNDMSNAPVGLFGGAICTSLRPAAVSTSYQPLASGTGIGWTFTCPRRTPFAVGSMLVPKQSSDSGALEITSDFRAPGGHKWTTGFVNVSDHSVEYFAGAVCIG